MTDFNSSVVKSSLGRISNLQFPPECHKSGKQETEKQTGTKSRKQIGKERQEERNRSEFVCKTAPMDVRAEVVVLVPVSIATQMCCRCSDASWEHCAAAVLTWATRANAQLTALSIRQFLFIAPMWRPGGTQAAQEWGPRRPGAQNWVDDGPELDGHPWWR